MLFPPTSCGWLTLACLPATLRRTMSTLPTLTRHKHKPNSKTHPGANTTVIGKHDWRAPVIAKCHSQHNQTRGCNYSQFCRSLFQGCSLAIGCQQRRTNIDLCTIILHTAKGWYTGTILENGIKQTQMRQVPNVRNEWYCVSCPRRLFQRVWYI